VKSDVKEGKEASFEKLAIFMPSCVRVSFLSTGRSCQKSKRDGSHIDIIKSQQCEMSVLLSFTSSRCCELAFSRDTVFQEHVFLPSLRRPEKELDQEDER
jgi:hypothetical protein